jgi:ABC-type phosphate transport system substrate-binding protein
MSRTLSAPRRGLSATVAGAVALVLMALIAVGLAPQANAAFVSGRCAGADITGRGASFARDAHNGFINNFQPIYCAGTPASATVTYEALGSGAGRDSMKVRNGAPRFGMTDEPPTPLEVQQMNTGVGVAGDPARDNANTGDDGQIHVIPAAVGSVAPLVNFPDNCDVNLLPVAAKTAEQDLDNDLVLDDVIRVRFTKAQFEGIWAKDANFERWDDVFIALQADADCDRPIIRVVRFDDSGTSFAFKDYLNKIDGAENWLTTYASGANRTREWPGAVFGPRADCAGTPNGPGSEVDATDQLTSGCSNGNGSLVSKLISTDGSVGYSDISTARGASPSLAVAPEANDNDTYWTQIPNGSDNFTEPTSSANGFRTDGPRGANCAQTTFVSVPATTFGNWAPVSGVNSPQGYGICTLTYGLVFDDNSDAWVNTPAEEAKARTVKDYWDSIMSAPAQAALFPNDYAPLPSGILAIAKAGVDSIDWNKGAGGGGNPGGGNPGGGNTGGGGNTKGPGTINSRFSLLRKSISSRTGGGTVSVKLPGAGKLEMIGTAKVGGRTIKVGKVTLTANKAGTFDLTLRPSGAAKRALQRRGSLKVTLQLTFTPNGGTPSTSTTSLTLKLRRQGRSS